MNTIPRRVWLEINLDTLTQNYRKIADAVAPAEVDGEASARPQSADLAICPLCRQRGQQAHDAGMTLQQEFRDGRTAAQIAVDLEYLRRMLAAEKDRKVKPGRTLRQAANNS